MQIAELTKTEEYALPERGLAVDVALALFTGLGVALTKKYLDFDLGIPGHAGTFWMAVLVGGALLNGRPGMTMIAGTSVGLWGVPVGLNHAVSYNAELYGTAAAVLEILLWMRFPLRNPLGAAAGAALAHTAKFGFVYANAVSSGLVKRFEAYGPALAVRNHILFGIAAGLLAWSAYNAANTLGGNKRRPAS